MHEPRYELLADEAQGQRLLDDLERRLSAATSAYLDLRRYLLGGGHDDADELLRRIVGDHEGPR